MTKRSSWPSRFGTLGEAVFGKDDPFNNTDSTVAANNLFSSDEMPETRSPISGKIYTSKAALRAEYKAHSALEVGTAYDNGYSPEKERERESTRRMDRVGERLRERYRNGG